MRPPAGIGSIAIAAFAIVTAGCGAHVVVADLDAREAQRCGIVLRANGVDAVVERDETAGEGRHRIAVHGDGADYRTALQLLEEHDLPRRRVAGLDAETASLIPSPVEERARYIRGLSEEIEAMLESVDGVVAAEVLVSLPERRPLAKPSDDPSSASTVIAYAGETSPVTADEIRAVVVRGVGAALESDRVTVILKPVVRPNAGRPVVRYERDRATEAAFAVAVVALVAAEAATVWRLRAARRRSEEDADAVAA
jgi:type III secretion protein J